MNSQQRRLALRAKKRAPKIYYKHPNREVTAYIRVYGGLCELIYVNDHTGTIELGSGNVNPNSERFFDTSVDMNGRPRRFTCEKIQLQKSSEREFLTAAGLL